jgi:FkbM family methyltransferase
MYPQARIAAIEPLPENVELLINNVRKNQLETQIKIIPRILWSMDDEERKIYYYNDNTNGKVHRFIGGAFPVVNNIEQKEFAAIKTIRLDTIFNKYNIQSARILKMDCQAAEYAILNGISQENLLKVQTITGEYQARTPELDPQPRTKLYQMVASHFVDKSTDPENKHHGAFVFERR